MQCYNNSVKLPSGDACSLAYKRNCSLTDDRDYPGRIETLVCRKVSTMCMLRMAIENDADLFLGAVLLAGRAANVAHDPLGR